MSGKSPGCSKSLMLAKAFIHCRSMDSCRSAAAQKRLPSLSIGTRKGIMVWAWMLWSTHSSKHEGDYGLGMDALVSGQRTHRNTKGIIMVWAWMLWSAHSSKHERKNGLGMDALVSGQRTHQNTNADMVWAWMLWSAHSSKHEGDYGLGMDALVSALIETRRELWFGHGCSGQRTHQNTNGNMVWAWMLWSAHSSKHEGNSGLGMVSVCSWNTKGIMVWAWMLWSAHSSKHGGHYGLGMDALVSVCSWNTKGIMWFGHGCSGQRVLLEHERKYGLGMDALVSVCLWNTKGIMVRAWMLW